MEESGIAFRTSVVVVDVCEEVWTGTDKQGCHRCFSAGGYAEMIPTPLKHCHQQYIAASSGEWMNKDSGIHLHAARPFRNQNTATVTDIPLL